MSVTNNAPPATFLSRARKRSQTVGYIAYDNPVAGRRINRLRLRNSGYLQRLTLVSTLSGQYGTAGPTALDPLALYGGPISWVTLRAGSLGEIVNVSGEALALLSMLDRQYRFGVSSFGVGAGNTVLPNINNVTAAPGTAAFADLWGFDVPVELDLANALWPIGLIQTAVSGMEVNLEVVSRPMTATTGSPGSGIYVPGGGATGPNPNGQTEIQMDFFDPIDEEAAKPPLAFLHQWSEDYYQLGIGTGDNRLRLPQNDYYTRVAVWMFSGAANALAPDSTSLTRMQLSYGPKLVPYDFSTNQLQYRMQSMYNVQMPSGVFVLDLLEETHTERDSIDASSTTDLELILTTSGMNVAGGAFAKVITERVIPLEVPVAGR